MFLKRRRPGAYVLAGAILLLSTLGTSGATRVGITLAAGDLAPGLVAPALSGWKYRASWKDYPLTIVNFWASWCEPCKIEMPVLQELHVRHGARNLAVVGVVLDPATDDVVTKFATDLGVSYTLVRGSSDTSNLWGGIGFLPTTFLVNQKGYVVRRYVGATPEQVEALKADVDAFFAERLQTSKPGPTPGAPPKPR